MTVESLNSKSFPLKGNGEWEYVEWISDELNAGKDCTISLKSSDQTELHLQDIRFVPEDAFVQVEFWDKFWNKPIASSNNQSVAAYASYDFQGRQIESYGETSSREVFLTTRNTYVSGMCGTSNQEHSLKKLMINGIEVPVTETPGAIEITVDNSTDELDVSWETVVDGQKVFYRMYEKGKESSAKYVEDDCCASTKKLIQDFIGTTMILDIAVSTTAAPYTITMNKSNVGWVDYGHVLNDGSNPIYMSEDDVNVVYFLDKGKVKRAYYDGSVWNILSETFSYDIDYLGSVKNNNSNFVFALPNFIGLGFDSYIDTYGQNGIGKFATMGTVLSKNDNKLNNMGDFEGAGVTSRLYRISSNVAKSVSYVVYEKTVSTKLEEQTVDGKKNNDTRIAGYKTDNPQKNVTKNETSLVSKILSGSSWVDCGTVANNSVNEVDLVVGPKDVPYVAYIGENASVAERKTLINNPDGKYDQVDDPNLIPSEDKDEYTVVKYYITVKHLQKNGSKNTWTGFSSSEGDVVTVDGVKLSGAKKIKMASDGTSLFMAVLIDNDSRYSLKVLKLEEVSGSLKATELYDYSTKSSTIAYLDEDNQFDLEIGHSSESAKNTLYLAFENEDNRNSVSVLKWETNKWSSVGNPAFAHVSDENSSLDLSIVNNLPYVVFKESDNSTKRKRRGKIVPMKYSVKDDKNLTISSIGNRTGSELFAKFRHYILNYQYDVDRTVSEIVFDINFSEINDVKALSVMNNGTEVFNWINSMWRMSNALFNSRYSGSLSSVKIPLSSGRNDIKVQVWSDKNRILEYTFVVRRDYIPGFFFTMKVDGDNVNDFVVKQVGDEIITNPTVEETNSSSSTVITPENDTYVVRFPEDGSTMLKICIEHNPPWKAIILNTIFSKNECVDYDVNEGFVISSSSSTEDLGSSSSSTMDELDRCGLSSRVVNPSQIVYVDNNCNKHVIDIIVAGRTLSSSSETPSWYSSSSCAGTGCSNNSSSSSCAGTGCSNNSSSSSCAGTSCSNNSNSSSSCNNIYCGSNEDSSSSIVIEHTESYGDVIKGTAIPADFASLLEYKFVGGEKINFANNVTVMAGQYAAKFIDIAADSKIYGSLKSAGNVFVGNNAYVNTFYIGGSSTIQHGARIDNLIEGPVTIPDVPLVNFSYGSKNINVIAENPVTLQPGNYENINVFADAKASFEPGVYRVKSLYVAPNAFVTLNSNHDLIQIWVQESVSIGDRAVFKSSGGASKVFIYGNGQNAMYVGVDANVDAVVAYPNGNVELAPKSNLSGSAWAKTVTAGANAVIK